MFAGRQERRFVMPRDSDRGLDLEEAPVPKGHARQLKFGYRGARILTDSRGLMVRLHSCVSYYNAMIQPLGANCCRD